jgi:hypothetical protein
MCVEVITQAPSTINHNISGLPQLREKRDNGKK